jgi:hypothetical protein
MKRIITLSAMMLLFLGSMFAQKLSYQAVVRNSQTNELMVSTTMNVTINILGANEQVLYTETHTGVQSNMNGLISLNIGEGTTTGSLNNVDWNGASIQSIITIQGIDPITIITPVNAVPYALQAANAAAGMDQEQADWTETDENAKSYIKHKPTIPEAPDLSNYVTLNKLNDTLDSYIKAETDPTVPDWAKAETKPTYSYNEITGTPTIPTVNDGTLTITKGNETYTFSANTDQNVTVDVTVPEMPVVNNDTLFINYGNTPKGYFTANANTNTTITIPETVVPTQTEIETLLQEHGFAKMTDLPTVNNDTLFLMQGNTRLGYFTANANANEYIQIPTTDLSNYVTVDEMKQAIRDSLANFELKMGQAISDSLTLFKTQLMAEVANTLPQLMDTYMAGYMAQNLPTLMQPYMEALNIHTASELTVIASNPQPLTLAHAPKADTEVLMYINGVMVGSTANGVISVGEASATSATVPVTYNPNLNYGYNLQEGDKVTFVYVY